MDSRKIRIFKRAKGKYKSKKSTRLEEELFIHDFEEILNDFSIKDIIGIFLTLKDYFFMKGLLLILLHMILELFVMLMEKSTP
jgi:hypothetical protein